MKTWGTQSQSWRDSAQMVAMAAIGLALCLFSATKASAALNHKVDLAEQRLALNSPQTVIETKPEFQELWFQALVKILQNGEVSQLPEVTTYYMAKGTSFDPSVERSVQYISLATRKSPIGELIPLGVSTVSEVWKKEGENWRVEQKIFVSSVQGKLQTIISASLLLDPEGTLVSRSQAPEASVDTPYQQERWEKEKQEWVALILGLS